MDREKIDDLITFAADDGQLLGAQHVAAKRLFAYDGEIYPHDGCAITLSVLMQDVGIAVPDIYQAIMLGRELKKTRGWEMIPLGKQQPGDVGTTCGKEPDHGRDHIYLVLKVNNFDEMIIADNQQQKPHFRWASGKGGKTPTKYFLRAT